MDDRDPYTFYGACYILFTNLINRYPEAEIVVLTPLHRRREIEPKADGLRHIKNNTILVVPILKDKYMPDGLNPNDAGHKIIANRIINFLKTL